MWLLTGRRPVGDENPQKRLKKKKLRRLLAPLDDVVVVQNDPKPPEVRKSERMSIMNPHIIKTSTRSTFSFIIQRRRSKLPCKHFTNHSLFSESDEGSRVTGSKKFPKYYIVKNGEYTSTWDP